MGIVDWAHKTGPVAKWAHKKGPGAKWSQRQGKFAKWAGKPRMKKQEVMNMAKGKGYETTGAAKMSAGMAKKGMKAFPKYKKIF